MRAHVRQRGYAALALLLSACVLDPVPLFDQDRDGLPLAEDCDDQDPTVGTRYLDQDGDGHGDQNARLECSPSSSALVADDCNDQDPAVYPAAEEVCNGVDDDCDGLVDESLTFETLYLDEDGDGHGDPETGIETCGAVGDRVEDGTDCDDGDPLVYPGAEEVCNGVDDDCDGRTDEGVIETYYPDADGDGYGKEGGRPVPACAPPAGHVQDASDCDDASPTTYPGAEEVCNGVDDDCDGVVDEEGTSVYYQDLDGDGYGDPNVSVAACDTPSGFVSDASDCDDTRALAYPGASETCNDADDDCDGYEDEDVAIVAVSGGIFHTLALCSDGTVWAWGNNDQGQLGDGTREDRSWPGRVEGLDHVVAVAAGGYHSLALRRTDQGETSVWAWGSNDHGQIGEGWGEAAAYPVELEGLDGVEAVAAGDGFSLVLRTRAAGGAGEVWGWGRNDRGQLGDGTGRDQAAPVLVEGLVGVARIRAGSVHVLALTGPDSALPGRVWAWGGNDHGQVGDGTAEDRWQPVQVSGPEGVLSLAAGGEHSLAVAGGEGDGGVLWAWGDNTYGQLGDGTTVARLRPARVEGVSPFLFVAAGYHHSLGIVLDDTGATSLLAWGGNSEGQLGTGTTSSSDVPVPVLLDAGVTVLAVGAAHSLAVADPDGGGAGGLWSWGSNGYGQLGDGTRENRLEPVVVAGI